MQSQMSGDYVDEKRYNSIRIKQIESESRDVCQVAHIARFE